MARWLKYYNKPVTKGKALADIRASKKRTRHSTRVFSYKLKKVKKGGKGSSSWMAYFSTRKRR